MPSSACCVGGEALCRMEFGHRTLAGAALSFWLGSIWLKVFAPDGTGRRGLHPPLRSWFSSARIVIAFVGVGGWFVGFGPLVTRAARLGVVWTYESGRRSGARYFGWQGLAGFVRWWRLFGCLLGAGLVGRCRAELQDFVDALDGFDGVEVV